MGGCTKTFYQVHKLRQGSNNIEYIKNWNWTMSKIIKKQEMIKELEDIRKFFPSSENTCK